jgi:hypothetical protein
MLQITYNTVFALVEGYEYTPVCVIHVRIVIIIIIVIIIFFILNLDNIVLIIML